MNDQNNKSGLYGIIIALLLLLSGGIGYYLWQHSKSLLAEKEKQELELIELEKEKADLIRSLDSLSNAYSDLRIENESLTSQIATSAELVQQRESAVKKITSKSTKEINELKKQLEELRKTVTELQTIISVLEADNAKLKGENQELKDENNQLKGDNEQLSGQVSTLAKQLEDQIRKTQSAQFKATSFKLELMRKDKTTGRARKARDLQVSFDLIEVPADFRGQQSIYLVVTDEKGKPIAASNPTKKTINAPAGQVEIIAVQTKAVNLGLSQRLNFSYKLEEKLKAGNYVVAIYCDRGLLGASSFRLS
ncbi:MAG: hypothetical protein ACK5SQ_01415 [Chitinophagales bacterium]|jgi:uncharacterized phage infection (PIP) family protein YhgE